jgi:hypothetical protein
MNPNYIYLKLAAGVFCTIGLYSVLYRENKFYRFFEHLFLGLAAGWTLVTLWKDTLYDQWWLKMVGNSPDTPGGAATNGYWALILLLPIGLMGYLVYSKKYNWISRIPIGIILGLWSGQQVQVWWNRYGPQIDSSLKPIVPNTWSSLTVPFDPATNASLHAPGAVYLSDTISNIVFILTLVSVLSYFLFSFDVRNRLLKGMTTSGRWLLMVGFGAIFGSTVMMRFSLLIDRMYFIWIEFFKNTVLHM